ncbi:hypothetical protein OIO90_005231 [Microbotryomycetes sp. JL221]|nr:hypothetical protein OIO90_005231 [Microbotryomycetes sp. JL221]
MQTGPAKFGVADARLEGKEKDLVLTHAHPADAAPAYDATTYVADFKGRRKVSLAEYMFYARRQRENEMNDKTVVRAKGVSQLIHRIKDKKGGGDISSEKQSETDSEALQHSIEEDLDGLTDRERELITARRALRVAGWASIFYLITTDILGPFNAGYSISQMGMVPGVLLFILFGVVAGITGWLLQWLFLHMDSLRYPVRTYGDLAERLFGSWARHGCSILQGVQLLLNTGLIVLSNGQSLSQITKAHLCFIACIVIFMAIGMVGGQIRGLQNLSIFANASVWLNLLIIFITLGAMAHSQPNFAAAVQSYGAAVANGPVKVEAIRKLHTQDGVNGAFNMVFAYGGSMIFPELLSEMRRPREFLKGMLMAQTLIIVVYLAFGIAVYAMQGQYTLALAYQGIGQYGLQTACNVIAVITGTIAAVLYANIGLKVFYVSIVEDLLRGPPLMSKNGRFTWSALVILWWGVAFVVGTAIPSVGALSGLVAAICIFQFTYTFPPVMALGLMMHQDAAVQDEEWTKSVTNPRKADSWYNFSRWRRGFFGGSWKRVSLKSLALFTFIAALATDGLGLWATGTVVREALSSGGSTSFSCTAPV